MHTIKKILLGLAFLTITATSVQALEWRASCNSEYSNPSDGTYIFLVKKGEVGGCPNDSKSGDNGRWKWSERSEVKSTSIPKGKWEWSAVIDIDRNCKPAYRTTLFQIHSARKGINPPSMIAINEYNKFRTDDGNVHNGKSVWNKPGNVDVPSDKFKLTAIIHHIQKSVNVDYFVNDKFVVTTKDSNANPSEPYLKFGIYRVNSNCDITHTYTDVKVKRVIGKTKDINLKESRVRPAGCDWPSVRKVLGDQCL